MNVELNEEELQVILSALAKLWIERPGWRPACIEPLAEKLDQGSGCFDSFLQIYSGSREMETLMVEGPIPAKHTSA